MVDKTHPKQAQDEAAFVEAYEQRLAGGAPEQVPPQWREEIEELVKLHAQIAALPLPDVAPSVRAVVLSAAAQAVADRPVSLWVKVANFLLRPGPILVGATAAAVIFALTVRDKPQARVDSGAVALLENAEPAATEKAAAPAVEPVAAPTAAPAAPAMGAEAQGGKAAEPSAPAAAAPEAAALAAGSTAGPRPGAKAIAAEPASVAPQGAADMAMNAAQRAAEPAKARAEEQAAKADDALEDQPLADQRARSAAPSPLMGALAEKEAQQKDAPAAVAAPEAKPGVNAQEAMQKRLAAPQQAERAPARQDADAANVAAEQVAVQAKSQAAVAKLRGEIERSSEPAKRAALLQQLLALAQQTGDAKSAAWAKSQLAAQAPGKAAAGKASAGQAAPAEKAEGDKAAPAKAKNTAY